MSCGKGDVSKGRDVKHCVCAAVRAIADAQDQVDDRNCTTSCVDNLLQPATRSGLDTVPFVLKDKSGKLFYATGGLTAEDTEVFHTPFFRIEHIDRKSCCATLSLLEPDVDVRIRNCCVDPDSLLDVRALRRTTYCIEVDLSCFCAIQCFDPALVAAEFRRKPRHYDKYDD